MTDSSKSAVHARWRELAAHGGAVALIAAVVLFFLGTGPVKGFAVTLSLGIITTIFTAYTLTRLMVATWFKVSRPKRIAI